MKKILTIALLTFTLSASAFWNNSWNRGYGNYDDNGIFGFNPYEFWEPRWYAEEMSNMIDEFDDNGWNNRGYRPYNYGNYGNYGYSPYNYRNRGNNYNFAPNMNTPWGAGAIPPTPINNPEVAK